MRKWRWVLGILALVLFVAYRVWTSDEFQKEFFPERYWVSEVERLESRVSLYETLLASTWLELREMRTTLATDAARLELWMKDPRLVDAFVEQRLKEIEQKTKELDWLATERDQAERELERARVQLAIVRGR